MQVYLDGSLAVSANVGAFFFSSTALPDATAYAGFTSASSETIAGVRSILSWITYNNLPTPSQVVETDTIGTDSFPLPVYTTSVPQTASSESAVADGEWRVGGTVSFGFQANPGSPRTATIREWNIPVLTVTQL